MIPNKRSEHQIDPSDIELNEWSFRIVMGDSWDFLDRILHNIFCTCGAENKELIDYKVYLNNINDIILRGKCSGCNTIASRYIETGEKKEKAEAADRIRKMIKK
jgi:hypothetical protein